MHNRTLRNAHTSSVEILDCFDPFKSSFPGSANHIALCARNPHRPGNHEVIWAEQAASVVVSKLLLWIGRETSSHTKIKRDNNLCIFSLLNETSWVHIICLGFFRKWINWIITFAKTRLISYSCCNNFAVTPVKAIWHEAKDQETYNEALHRHEILNKNLKCQRVLI